MRPFSRQPTTILIAILAVLAIILALPLLDTWFFDKADFTSQRSSQLTTYQLETDKTIEQYNLWVISENRRIFEWHFRSTKIIFWISILITVIGMAFAFWQFVEASHSEQTAVKADEVKIKTQFVSLAFKSRSLATFMMAMSLAYLLIYVTMVYPVKPVRSEEEIDVGQKFFTAEEDPEGMFPPDNSQDELSPESPSQNYFQEDIP